MDDSRGLSVQLCGAYTRLHVTRMRFAYQVYNLTPYLQYHPGGVDILVKTAGKDCTALFNRYHAWVNLEGIAGVSQRSDRRSYLIHPQHRILNHLLWLWYQKLVIGTIAASDASAAQAKSPSAARARPLPMDAPPPKLKLGLNITEMMGPDDGSEGKDEKGSQGASDLDKSGDSSK